MPAAEDPDVTPADLVRAPVRLGPLLRERADVLAVIAAGGAAGSLGRWAIGEAITHDPGRFAWATFVVNVTGACALGLLMALIAGPLARTRLVRPFLGVGVLGGWTTFSTYALDTRAMLADGRVVTGLLGYLGGTLLAGLVAAWLGLVLGRALITRAAL